MDYQLGPGPLQVDQNTIDEKIKGDIGIVENGDVATHAIPSGYYVIWKGDLYIAKTDISSGTTLSTSNLTAKPNGLGADVAVLNSNKANIANLSYGSYTYTSQAAMETGLVNLATTLGANKTTVIYLYPNFGSSIFGGAPGVATIETGANTSYFSVLFHNYSGVFYGKYLNGTWTWESLAFNSKVTYGYANLTQVVTPTRADAASYARYGGCCTIQINNVSFDSSFSSDTDVLSCPYKPRVITRFQLYDNTMALVPCLVDTNGHILINKYTAGRLLYGSVTYVFEN